MLLPDNDNQHSVLNETADLFRLMRLIKDAWDAQDHATGILLRAELTDMCFSHLSPQVRRMARAYSERLSGVETNAPA